MTFFFSSISLKKNNSLQLTIALYTLLDSVGLLSTWQQNITSFLFMHDCKTRKCGKMFYAVYGTFHCKRNRPLSFSAEKQSYDKWYRTGTSNWQEPQFGTSKHYRKAHGSLLSGWLICNYTACCWPATSSNILIVEYISGTRGFESYSLHCSIKCWILVP